MHESRTIRLPTTIWPVLHRLARAQAALWQQQQREPSPDELAEVLQCEQEHVLLLLHLQHEPISLEQPVYAEDEAITLGWTLEAPDDTEQHQQQREVADLLNHLNPRERRVIETRYQLGHEATSDIEDIPLSYTEVSRQLGMRTRLVKAVETRALVKLRFWAERKPYVPDG